MLELIEEIYDFDRKMVERQAALGVQNGHSHDHSGHDGHSHDHSHDHSHGDHGDHSHDHSHGGEAFPEDEYEYPADEPILEESFAERNFGKLYSYYTAHPYIVIAALGFVLTILLSALLDWASQRPSRSNPITEEL
ncbi:hypothetical protein M427DRAFT_54978 [Gonapodya prolifera JEL478]|uniref:Uncharacterized protein n=1 Tax=Gonapodya prolifera (strain JEL478) TaxID=1344416 RepID=A0A139AK69_GONPJ|nr:hypothetical protein M427DRAFT_54978 [Gonapodya prolifera JEL478]|eukprot:KXS16944.1 hypothetical protein M427DRAFT_54978 [Gonapodya prolifera JEL478]